MKHLIELTSIGWCTSIKIEGSRPYLVEIETISTSFPSSIFPLSVLADAYMYWKRYWIPCQRGSKEYKALDRDERVSLVWH
jgi:hypothetical protein